jgi:hypothetical protein
MMKFVACNRSMGDDKVGLYCTLEILVVMK